MAKIKEREEALRLRTEERLSLEAISKKVGVSQGTVSRWLSNNRLTASEIVERESASGRANAWRMKNGKVAPMNRGDESRIHRIVSTGGLSTSQKGRVSEAAVLLRLVSMGLSVFGSPFDGDRSDWIVDDPKTGKVSRVQVKTAVDGPRGLPTISLRGSSGERYKNGEFEFLVGYDMYADRCYVWTEAELRTRRCNVTVSADALEAWGKMRA